MKQRTLRVLGMIIGLLVAAGSGRPGAAYGSYSRPDCIRTYPYGPLTVKGALAERVEGEASVAPAVIRQLARTNELVTVIDEGEGDHWNLVVVDGLTGQERWRKEGLGPLERAVIPASVWQVGGLYALQTERWLKDGRVTTGRALVEIADQATYERLRGMTYSLAESLYYALSQDGAVSARATLRDTGTGAVVLTTKLDPEPGLYRGGHPIVQVPLSTYLDAADTERPLTVTWEQLDRAGRTLDTEVDPIVFKVRAPLKPTWVEGGGGVIGPAGTIAWKAVEGARWYRLSIPGEGDGQSVEVIVPGSTTTHQFTTPLAPGFHWVSLAAEGGGCRQDWSDGLPIVVDDLPWHGILSPGPGTVTERDLTVKLRRADWIHGYLVELFDGETGQLLQARNLYRSQQSYSVSFDTKQLTPGRVYRLRATATLEVSVPQVDQVTFTYQPPIRLAFKQALQGAHVARENLPLSWDPIPGATSYTLLLTKVSTFVNLQSRLPAGQATSLTLGRPELESGRTYRLAIEATMADGTKMTSAPVSFSVR